MLAADIDTLRKIKLRDYVSGATKYGHYNRVTGAEYVTDADIDDWETRIENRWEEELDEIEELRKIERLNEGDTDADATTISAAVRLDALMDLITSEILMIQASDPAYIGTIPGEDLPAAIAESLRTRAKELKRGVLRRTGGYSQQLLARA